MQAIITATKRAACPTLGYGSTAKIVVTAKIEQIGGNQFAHFSVTCDIWAKGRNEAGGCMHREAVKYWPEIAPIVALHLSDYPSGAPMHAEANGWYWMAGALGGAGERYHGGNAECQQWNDDGTFAGYRASTPDECLKIYAKHVRVPIAEAQNFRDVLKAATYPREVFATWIQSEQTAARWASEAKAAFELLQKLSTEATATKGWK